MLLHPNTRFTCNDSDQTSIQFICSRINLQHIVIMNQINPESLYPHTGMYAKSYIWKSTAKTGCRDRFNHAASHRPWVGWVAARFGSPRPSNSRRSTQRARPGPRIRRRTWPWDDRITPTTPSSLRSHAAADGEGGDVLWYDVLRYDVLWYDVLWC